MSLVGRIRELQAHQLTAKIQVTPSFGLPWSPALNRTLTTHEDTSASINILSKPSVSINKKKSFGVTTLIPSAMSLKPVKLDSSAGSSNDYIVRNNHLEIMETENQFV